MRRIFWLALGLGAGGTAAFMLSRWMARKAEALSPQNVSREVAQAASSLAGLLRAALAEGKRAAAEREAELRTAIA